MAVEKAWHVFDQDPLGLSLFDELCILIEKSASITFQAATFALVGYRQILAWEAATPEVRFRHLVCGEALDVTVKGNIRPMFLQNLLAKGVNLTLENAFHAGAFKAEIKASNSCEEGCEANWFIGPVFAHLMLTKMNDSLILATKNVMATLIF